MQDKLDRHFAGPAFLPWGRMGNLRYALKKKAFRTQVHLIQILIRIQAFCRIRTWIQDFAGSRSKFVGRKIDKFQLEKVKCFISIF
jgi:hypothetical protein